MIKKIFSSFGFLLVLMLFSFLLIMGEEKPQPTAAQPLAAKGFLSSQNLSQLSTHLGVSIPYLSPVGAGQVEDIPFSGGYAQVLTWTDENNVTSRCARPAAAASLLRTENTAPSGEYCTLDGMTAFICTDDQTTQLHFGDDLAAYCLSYTGSAQTLIELTNHLQFTP